MSNHPPGTKSPTMLKILAAIRDADPTLCAPTHIEIGKMKKINGPTVLCYANILRKAGLVHICSWRPNPKLENTFAAEWAIGPGVDAIQPKNARDNEPTIRKVCNIYRTKGKLPMAFPHDPIVLALLGLSI